jgi:hypothetical protein
MVGVSMTPVLTVLYKYGIELETPLAIMLLQLKEAAMLE